MRIPKTENLRPNEVRTSNAKELFGKAMGMIRLLGFRSSDFLSPRCRTVAAGRISTPRISALLPASTLRFLALSAFALVLCPHRVEAHVEGSMAGGFLPGLEHPISGLDHVLAMIAVGLWGAQLGRPAIWMLPVAFPMMMAVGAFLGLIGIGLPGVEVGIALSGIALGAMVLAEARPPLWAACLLVALFAIFHGHAHGTELPEGASGLLYSIGFVIATGCLHACGIAIGLMHRWPIGRMALRAAGACVALGGCFFLWRAVA